MITDFASLKATINSKMERSYTDDKMAEFIGLAEAQIRRRLSGYRREITTTLTTDTAGLVALPSDFLGFVGVSFGGVPYRYAISGTNLYVRNGASRAFDVIYYGKLPALSDANPTNWLMDMAPDAYYLMAEAQARSYNEEWEVAAGLEGKGLDAIADLNLQSVVAQYGRAGMNLPVQAF
jgi:hypothetical protein